MRIECPGCETAYEVPESQVRPGRSVRCAQCDRQWLPFAEPAGAVMLPSVEPETEAAFAVPELPEDPELPDDEDFTDPPVTADGRVRLRRSAAPKPALAIAPVMARLRIARFRLPIPLLPWIRSSLRPSGLGWVASVVALAGLLVAAGYWRMAIMQDWPPSVRLYTALGARSPPT